MTKSNTVQVSTNGTSLNSQVTVTDQLVYATLVTNPTLSSSAAFTSPFFSNWGMTQITGRIYCNLAGSLVLQASDDGITWDTVSTHAVTASTVLAFTDTPNGAVMQYVFTPNAGSVTAFRLSAYAIGARSV